MEKKEKNNIGSRHSRESVLTTLSLYREVKVELIGDETKLTRNGENGLFELFLLSAGTQNGVGGGTLQRKTNGTLTRRVGKERNDGDMYNVCSLIHSHCHFIRISDSSSSFG